MEKQTMGTKKRTEELKVSGFELDQARLAFYRKEGTEQQMKLLLWSALSGMRRTLNDLRAVDFEEIRGLSKYDTVEVSEFDKEKIVGLINTLDEAEDFIEDLEKRAIEHHPRWVAAPHGGMQPAPLPELKC